MQSLVQILAVGPVLNKEFEGRPYKIQECECVMLNDDGSAASVGVLRLSDAMKGDNAPKPGTYSASFAMRARPKDRRIEALLTGLVSVKSPAAVKAA
jgi:hypothetical protein